VNLFTPTAPLSCYLVATWLETLAKGIRFTITNDRGVKRTLEGPVTREDLLKFIDTVEFMDAPFEPSVRPPDQETFFGKVQILLETSFTGGNFSSSDVARELEERYGMPVKLSTVSTYLQRLSEKQYIRREKFGNSWVYRRVYMKPGQIAEK
jgi:penicillinase repressor